MFDYNNYDIFCFLLIASKRKGVEKFRLYALQKRILTKNLSELVDAVRNAYKNITVQKIENSFITLIA